MPGQQEGGREGEREREREEREGGLLAPSAGTSVEGLTREGRQVKVRESKSFLYLENVPNESVTGYLHSHPSALCLFGPLSFLEAASLEETR